MAAMRYPRTKKQDQPAVIKPNPAVQLVILHEDADLLVVYKPAGLVSQPGLGHTTDALLNGLFATHGNLLRNMGAARDWGMLHRLDKPTSGLLVVALRPKAYDLLREEFEQRRVMKEYLALVRGKPVPPQGVIQARLKEVLATVKKVIVSRTGQEAVSAYQVITGNERASLVSVKIKTGRLHQIRAHMMFLGNPVLGDDLYGIDTKPAVKMPGVPRLCLHCLRLGFRHPVQKVWIEFTAPLPPDLAAAAKKLDLSVPAEYLPKAVAAAKPTAGA